MKVAAGERSVRTHLRDPPFNLRHVRFDRLPEARVWRCASLGSDTSHSTSGEAVKDDVPRVSVVEDVPHNRLVRHFRMVGVCDIDRVRLPLADVHREWFAVIRYARVVGTTMSLDELGEEGVRASRVVRGIRKPEDVIVLSHRKIWSFAKLRQLLL